MINKEKIDVLLLTHYQGIPNENLEDWGLNSEELVVKIFQNEIFCNR